MNTLKPLSLAALALSGILLAAPAQAGSGAHWSINIGLPIALPLPPLPPLPGLVIRNDHVRVQVQPAPLYIQPAAVYVQPPVVSGRPGWRDRDRDGIPDRYDRYDNRGRQPAWRSDRDRDGIPDRHDRYDNRRGQPAWRGHDGADVRY